MTDGPRQPNTTAPGTSNAVPGRNSQNDHEALFVIEEEVTLKSIGKSHQIQFPVVSTYGNSWDAVSAFRELVQNWRDGIIQSFKLYDGRFDVVREDQSTEDRTDILFKALNPDAGAANDQPCLGYIRFSGKASGGSVEITNRNAVLQPKHLYFGETSKTGRSHMAGTHGEGLKMALLVLMRDGQNHRVRCMSGDFSWNFNFTSRGKLVARLNRLAPSTLEKEEDHARALYKSGQLPFIVMPHCDIKFVIGERGKGRDGSGRMRERDQVTLDTFNRWCKSALFLQESMGGSQNIIKTSRGDLLLDNAVRGNLYLKGLLLQETTEARSASISGRRLKFGYNFSHGETNRDRKSLFALQQESWAIFNIWDSALAKQPNLVGDLSDMLLSKDPEYADVVSAKDMVKSSTAIRLKDHLFSDSSKWYYCQEEAMKNLRLSKIIEGFGRQGFQLTDAYWKVLKRFNFVRTADDEQRKRFLNSTPALVPGDAFPHDVNRLLQTCLRGCTQTARIVLQFVVAGQLEMDTYYVESENVFKVHDKWLVKENIMEELGLADHVAEIDIVFHVVQRLFSELMDQLPEKASQQNDPVLSKFLKRQTANICSQRLLEYVRTKSSIMLERSPFEPNALILNWGWISASGVNDSVVVQLHLEASCVHLCRNLLASDWEKDKLWCFIAQDGTEEDVKGTQCHAATVPADLGTHYFGGLVNGSKYFAVLVTSTDPGSIVLTSGLQEVPNPPAVMVDLTEMEEPELTAGGSTNSLSLPLPYSMTQNDGGSGSSSSLANNAGDTPSQPQQTNLSHLASANAQLLSYGPTSQTPRIVGPSATLSLRSDHRPNGDIEPRDSTGASYRRGKHMNHLDILQPRDWFEDRDYDSNGVIIGIPREEVMRGSKRRREDSEER